MKTVYVVDTWDEKKGEARVRVFSSPVDANKALDKFLDGDPDGYARFGEVIRRKVR